MVLYQHICSICRYKSRYTAYLQIWNYGTICRFDAIPADIRHICRLGYVEIPDNVQRSFGARKWSEKTKMVKFPKSKKRNIS